MAVLILEILLLLVPLLGLVNTVSSSSNFLHVLGPQAVNIRRLQKSMEGTVQARELTSGLLVQGANRHSPPMPPEEEWKGLKLGWFEQPLDHFDSSNPHTFKQRYWVNTRHYTSKEGTPVIVLDGGEVDALERLPFLDTGIVDILARETGGIGILLEHRYYGESIPVENFTTDSLRWLTNEQAIADSFNFMTRVGFEGIGQNLSAPNTPWIYYGGSYAGARAAHMRILHPEIVYGAIASSALIHATLENWQYNDVIRRAADPECAEYLEKATEVIDDVLFNGISRRRLKDLFGLADLRHDDDFASLITLPLAQWEYKTWHHNVVANEFERFCAELTAPYGNSSSDAINNLPFGHPKRLIDVGGDLSLDFAIVNWASYIRDHQVIGACLEEVGDINSCFTTYNDKKFQDTDLGQRDRPWIFQMCTQWGTFVIAPPDYDQPRIISHAVDLEYKIKICQQAFLPGEHYRVPLVPNITSVNALGGYDITTGRLAFIDGEFDPWRPLTPHSGDAKSRPDTLLRPFQVIPGAVHLWDMHGLSNLSEEPPEIRKVHADIIRFVQEWLKEWEPPH